MESEIKRVRIKYGTRQKLADMFRVTGRTVTNAINGMSNSPIAKKIRVVALWALYFGIDLLRNSRITLLCFLFPLIVLFLAMIGSVYKAESSKDFHRSSQISKLIMIWGIGFMGLGVGLGLG
jgi:transcriptional regulator with XRE-family HTH domain